MWYFIAFSVIIARAALCHLFCSVPILTDFLGVVKRWTVSALVPSSLRRWCVSFALIRLWPPACSRVISSQVWSGRTSKSETMVIRRKRVDAHFGSWRSQAPGRGVLHGWRAREQEMTDWLVCIKHCYGTVYRSLVANRHLSLYGKACLSHLLNLPHSLQRLQTFTPVCSRVFKNVHFRAHLHYKPYLKHESWSSCWLE